MTQFCTSRDHAIAFGKFALRIRKEVDHSVSFETTPDAAHSLSPGDYIRLGVSIQHQERENGYTERLKLDQRHLMAPFKPTKVSTSPQAT